MVKKNVLSVAMLLLVWCSSNYCMDYGPDVAIETVDGKIVLCPFQFCQLSSVIGGTIKFTGETSGIKLNDLTESDFRLLMPLLPNLYFDNINKIRNQLRNYSMQALVRVLKAAEYLDISCRDNETMLCDVVAEEIAELLLDDDNKNKFLSSDSFLAIFDSISDTLSNLLANKLSIADPGFKKRIKEECSIPSTILSGHFDDVRWVTFNKKGDKVASASWDKTVRIWDVATGKCVRVLEGHEAPVLSVMFNEEADKAVSASADMTVRIWDIETGSCERVLEGHRSCVNSAAFNKKGDKLVSASHDGTAKLWDVKTGKAEQTMQHAHVVWRAAFNSGGDKIVSSSLGGKVKMWDVSKGTCERIFGDSDSFCVAFNEVGDRIVAGDSDGKVRVWSVETGLCTHVFEEHKGLVYLVAFNEAGNKVVSVSKDNSVRIWSIITGECEHMFVVNSYGVMSTALNKKGNMLVTIGNDSALVVVDLRSLLRCEEYLHNELTLEQALFLVCWNDALKNNQQLDISKKAHLQKIFDSIENKDIKDIILSGLFFIKN